MEYGSVLTCTIVDIKQRDTIHHWRHRWIEMLIVLDIIYHLLKTQSRVGTQAILSTWTSYFCILRLDSGCIIPTSYCITICRTFRAGQRAWLPLASMPLINQGGQYKLDSNITGAVGPTYQCIFNIFLFLPNLPCQKVSMINWICVTTWPKPTQGSYQRAIHMPLFKKAGLQVHSNSAHPSTSQPVIVGAFYDCGSQKPMIKFRVSKNIWNKKYLHTTTTMASSSLSPESCRKHRGFRGPPVIISGEQRVACRKSVNYRLEWSSAWWFFSTKKKHWKSLNASGRQQKIVNRN